MATDHEYICNGCMRPTKRSMLTVKRTQFTTMGMGARILRSRVKSWLCTDCVRKDADWNIPANRLPSERAPLTVTRKDFELRG